MYTCHNPSQSSAQDIRGSTEYKQAQELHEALRQPGANKISDGAELHVSANGETAVFTGTIFEDLDGQAPTRICQVKVGTGEVSVLTSGPNTDRHPKYSPDGKQIAFLSDRKKKGSFQLYILTSNGRSFCEAPPVDGWIEYLEWSPDGRRILVGVAEHGADTSGGQGAIPSAKCSDGIPSWMPVVVDGSETHGWRRTWIYNLDSNTFHRSLTGGSNVWEATWCGNDAFLAVVSAAPGEGAWYTATLRLFSEIGEINYEIYSGDYQLGRPTASPSGRHFSVIEAVCSDRGIVAGELILIDAQTRNRVVVETANADITHAEWRSDRYLLLAGVRGLETVVGVFDLTNNSFRESWTSGDISTSGSCVNVSGYGEAGDFVIIGEGFLLAPEIATVRAGIYTTCVSFDWGYQEFTDDIKNTEQVSWSAPDGLEIQGWLLTPRRQAPYPVLMNIHGGPSSHWRSSWLGRPRGAPILLLLRLGYAVFLPNPRGSSGRGREFAELVQGDMGGADAQDLLSGLDHLVERGIADPERIGVLGVSYGGYMASWLITQDSRFAAAVAVAPIINFLTEHLLSSIPYFVKLFLKSAYTDIEGRYFERSPIMHAHKSRTPVLSICGALDRCTPSVEAIQFHNALLENNSVSMLINYPEEGHGVRAFPAAIDYAARIVSWFKKHMPPRDVELSG